MPTRARLRIVWFMMVLAVSARAADAQDRITLTADLLFYGDNTEFRNPFREGETIFGTSGQLAAEIGIDPRVRIRIGAFGNVRFGSDQAFDSARPVISLGIHGKRSTFLMGTFPSTVPTGPIGPDRAGPHGLLPPIQRETLAFDRPYEAGLRWTFEGPRYQHDAWINWQRLNTQAHRERFDTGLNARVRVTGWLALPVQLHVVHEGGQLHSAGPVADSTAFGTGVALSRSTRVGVISFELLGIASRDVPDRERPAAARSGAAVFARAAVERNGWRAHTIAFRGDDFVKDEGDPNYQSVRRNGTSYRGIRDYSELGVARRFRLAPAVALEAAVRLHRTEQHYEYSYRITAIAALGARVR